ncbi:hypothetical protein VTI74DRAFT_11028 [Chaetomium olivicolor]
MSNAGPEPAAESLDPRSQRMGSSETGGEGEARLGRLQSWEGIETSRDGEVKGQNCDKSRQGNEQNHITMHRDRPYVDWTGLWGGVFRKSPGVGALSREGYLPRVGHSEPWICLRRDCQTIFADAWTLGGHFSIS